MTDRSESREDEREDPSTGEQADAEPVDERTDAEPIESDDRSDHLDDVEDGAGCVEIWERLSERREAERREAEQDA
jgi:hypothetical protein